MMDTKNLSNVIANHNAEEEEKKGKAPGNMN